MNLDKYISLKSRYLLRKEFFGGLLVDRKTRRIDYLNKNLTIIYSHFNGAQKLKDVVVNLASIFEAPEEAVKETIKEILKSHGDKILFYDKPVIRENITPINSIEEFEKLPKTHLTAPIWITAHITYNCNLRCKHCYISAPKRKTIPNLPYTVWKNLFDEANDMGVGYIIISGGEPLLSPYLDKLVQHSYEIGMSITVATNGTLLNQRFVDLFKKYEVHDVHVSIDGFREVHNEFRGDPTAFDRTINGIKLLVENDIYTHVGITLTKKNYETIDSLIRFLFNLGVHSISVTPMIPVGMGVETSSIINYAPNIREIKHAMNLIEEVRKEFKNREFRLQGLLPIERGSIPPEKIKPLEEINLDKNLFDVLNGCSVATRGLSISANGDVYPCIMMDGLPMMKCGSILTNSLKEIWENSPLLKKLRKMKLSDLPETCRKCPIIEECRGGCLAAKLWAFGNKAWEYPDPRCPKIKLGRL